MASRHVKLPEGGHLPGIRTQRLTDSLGCYGSRWARSANIDAVVVPRFPDFAVSTHVGWRLLNVPAQTAKLG